MILIEGADRRTVVLTKTLEVLQDSIWSDGYKIATYKGNTDPALITTDYQKLLTRIEEFQHVHGFGFIRLATWCSVA